MARKHNQYRNRITRRAGSEDMDWQDKQRVKKIMESYGYTCLSNPYLIVPRDEDNQAPAATHPGYIIFQTVNENMLGDWKLAARPDITCHNAYGNLELIVEIDGAVHKKDLDERPIYTELGIAHIIINKEYLKKEMIPWDVYIDMKLKLLEAT